MTARPSSPARVNVIGILLADLEVYGAPELYRVTDRDAPMRARWYCAVRPWDWPDSPIVEFAYGATPLSAATLVLTRLKANPPGRSRGASFDA